MQPDFARIKGVPLEVVLLLDDVSLEDEAFQYLKEEWGLVGALGEEHVKLVLTNPKDPDFAYFRVRVKYRDHPRRPLLDFKYLKNFYECPEFPENNPMKDVLVGTYMKFKEHVKAVTNHALVELDFPYEIPVSPQN